MSTPKQYSIADAIREAGESWLLDWFPGGAAAADAYLRQTVEAAAQAYARVIGPGAVDYIEPPSEAALLTMRTANPHKFAAFIQALAATSNPEMLVMVWRMLHGDTIKSLDVAFADRQEFHLHVRLADEPSGAEYDFHSDNIDDAALLRHLGILKVDGRPAFDGFYPLRR